MASIKHHLPQSCTARYQPNEHLFEYGWPPKHKSVHSPTPYPRPTTPASNGHHRASSSPSRDQTDATQTDGRHYSADNDGEKEEDEDDDADADADPDVEIDAEAAAFAARLGGHSALPSPPPPPPPRSPPPSDSQAEHADGLLLDANGLAREGGDDGEYGARKKRTPTKAKAKGKAGSVLKKATGAVDDRVGDRKRKAASVRFEMEDDAAPRGGSMALSAGERRKRKKMITSSV
ncbi:MAG: hypothetical protein Q9163_001682 [Psora crenata]